jgi:hypothetical protein
MLRVAIATSACLIAGLQIAHAQAPAAQTRSTVTAPAAAPSSLPVRRVVLYKNGVGYFEHLGQVRDNGTISVDFSSSQLDDVLKSLTVIDLGNGRVNGISYNSDAPLGERLGSLRLALGERATLPQLLDALRGARLEVRVGERVVSGRLLGVERRMQGTGATAVSRDELTIVSDAGEIRTVELTPAASVRLIERESVNQVGAYLGLLGSTRVPDRRRLTISTTGTGPRDLLVSYVSEVPVWKTTYRIVLSPEEQPMLQGWAIVDNTTGEDWNSVELSLVAGAPQSFIQKISQPQYARRPVVQPSQLVLLTPQTHGSTLSEGSGGIRGTVSDSAGGALPGVTVRLVDSQRRTVTQAVTDWSGRYLLGGVAPGSYRLEFSLPGFSTVAREAVSVEAGAETRTDASMRVGALEETITVMGETPAASPVAAARRGNAAGVSVGVGGGQFVPPAAAAQGGDVVAQSGALGELFEYRVTAPISILRNQSALVPIIRSGVSIERVSLWNGRGGPRPVRALWVANTSGLTLDAGAFTVIEDGAFAGEGLVELLKPDEKRLLSYAVDLGVQVDSQPGSENRVVTHIVAQRGVIVQQAEQRMRRAYTIRNNDTTARTVVIEHPKRAGWTLASSVHPVETTTDTYRFTVPAPAKETVTLTVDETRPLETRYEIGSMTNAQLTVLVRDSGDNRTVMDALEPILSKKAAMSAILGNVATREAEVKQISGDQQRIRQNLQSLKDTQEQRDLVKRFAAQLTQQEDRLEVLRREIADLQRAHQQASTELLQLLERLVLDLRVERASS